MTRFNVDIDILKQQSSCFRLNVRLSTEYEPTMVAVDWWASLLRNSSYTEVFRIAQEVQQFDEEERREKGKTRREKKMKKDDEKKKKRKEEEEQQEEG